MPTPTQTAAPRIRRAHTKMFVRILRARDDFDAVAAAVPDTVDLEVLEAGFNIGWGEVRPYADLLEFIFERFGREGLVELWEQSFSTLMAQPFLSAFIDVIRPRAGTSIADVARRAPAVYGHIARDCGVLRWSAQGSGGTLHLTGFPDGYPIVPWCLSVLGCMRAAASALGFGPDAVSLIVEEGSSEAAFCVRSEHCELASLG